MDYGFSGKRKNPFKLEPQSLYTVADLYDKFDVADEASWAKCYDYLAYKWFFDSNIYAPRQLNRGEAVAARLHDSAIEFAINQFILEEKLKIVGFMGGHDVPRSAPAFRQTVDLARDLRRKGLRIVTGGGAGLMEAANLGAFLAPFADEELDRALSELGDFDSLKQSHQWLRTACNVRGRLLGGDWRQQPSPLGRSLGIPTWLYGHEPPNLFASDIGKYFFNSVREDGLVTIASGGIVFAPGSAGTVQEVFQNATVNYYKKAPLRATPMVFLGRAFWNPAAYDPPQQSLGHPKPLYPLVEKLARDASSAMNGFTEALLLSDDPVLIAKFIDEHVRQELPTFADLRVQALIGGRLNWGSSD